MQHRSSVCIDQDTQGTLIDAILQAHRSALAQLPCQVAACVPKDQLMRSPHLPDEVRISAPSAAVASDA
jgi:hypothetical protein